MHPCMTFGAGVRLSNASWPDLRSGVVFLKDSHGGLDGEHRRLHAILERRSAHAGLDRETGTMLAGGEVDQVQAFSALLRIEHEDTSLHLRKETAGAILLWSQPGS